MEPISSFFQCKWCLDQYSDPVLFPCGYTACEKHTKELRKEEWKCRLCGGTHNLDDGEIFPMNRLVSDMMVANLSRLDFGPTYKAANEEVDDLELTKAELNQAINEPRDHASTLCKKYRNQVDLGRQDLLKIVEAVCESKNKLITEHEQEVEKNLVETASTKRKLIESVEPKIKKWRQSLRELVVNEALWKEIASEAQELKKDIQSQVAVVLDPPVAIQYMSKSLDTSVWTELAKKAGIREYKLTEKSVLVSEVSKITKTALRDEFYSQPFTHNGAEFKILVQFKVVGEVVHLGAFLKLMSTRPKKVEWRFNVLGKHSHIIRYTEFSAKFTTVQNNLGKVKLISINDILAHPAYDAKEDAVRVEVVIKDLS